jgi:hypothetical protein
VKKIVTLELLYEHSKFYLEDDDFIPAE